MSLPADLAPERVAELLNTARYGRSLTVLASTSSTNDDARKAALAGAPDGHVVIADAQERGRGAHGHTWSSPAGSDLYLSIVARVPVPLADLPPLTLALGIAVAETVDVFLARADTTRGPIAQVKWPNDVWVERKKVSGILVESVSSGQEIEALVLGIGLNVRRREFPPWLDTPPTSLALEGAPANRAEVLATLLATVEKWVNRFAAGGANMVVKALESRLALRGELAECDGLQGNVEGISANGALRLRVNGVVRALYAGRLRPVV